MLDACGQSTSNNTLAKTFRTASLPGEGYADNEDQILPELETAKDEQRRMASIYCTYAGGPRQTLEPKANHHSSIAIEPAELHESTKLADVNNTAGAADDLASIPSDEDEILPELLSKLENTDADEQRRMTSIYSTYAGGKGSTLRPKKSHHIQRNSAMQ